MIGKLLSSELSRSQYSRTLCRYYSFHIAVEPQLVNQITDYQFTPKFQWLQTDIDQFGYRQSDCPPIDACNIEQFEEALGTLYVLEGATLGGQMMLRMLKQTLPSLEHRYFTGYGKSTGQKWQQFKAYLGEVEPLVDAVVVIAAANRTFRAFDQYLARAEDDCTTATD